MGKVGEMRNSRRTGGGELRECVMEWRRGRMEKEYN